MTDLAAGTLVPRALLALLALAFAALAVVAILPAEMPRPDRRRRWSDPTGAARAVALILGLARLALFAIAVLAAVAGTARTLHDPGAGDPASARPSRPCSARRSSSGRR